MKQRRIKELLVEAANANTSWQRASQIQKELDNEVCKGESQSAGLDVILNELYVDTIRNRRDHLPLLLPVFAMICGDRDDNIVTAGVDWSLV